MIQKLLLKIYGPDWKTSLSADLSAIMWLSGFISTAIVITPQTPKWLIFVSGAAGFIATLGKSWTGRQQYDAGTQLAMDKKTGEVVIADSHEIPFDKSLKPIVDPNKEP